MHLTSFVDDVSDVLIALLNQVLEEADGLSSHKIDITDKSPTGDNIDIHLAIVDKPKRTRDNTQTRSLQDCLNEMSFVFASTVLIIQFQRNSHDENNKKTKVTYEAVRFEEKIELNCGGQRVQYSVFEIEVDYAQWTFLKNRLCELIDPEQDSLRFYYLGKSWQSKVEHVGAKPVIDLNGPLIL